MYGDEMGMTDRSGSLRVDDRRNGREEGEGKSGDGGLGEHVCWYIN